jgi:hypothetical protein
MAVGQARKTYEGKRNKDLLAQRDVELIESLTKQLDRAKGHYNKWKQKKPGDLTYGGSEKSWNRRINSLQASINEARGIKKQDFKKNPLKIDKKGLTPARKLSKGESKIGTSKTIGGKGPGGLGTAKQKEEARKRMIRRGLSKRMGQRKAGGTVKKYGHGGKVGKVSMKKCPRDGIAIKGKTRA